MPGLRAADGQAQGDGSVVNIGSTAAHIGYSHGAIYATLKAAVVHYTRCLAAEVQADGVRINAVSPGPTKTARFQATRTVDPVKMDSSRKSLARYAEPDEIADAVAFLLAAAAASSRARCSASTAARRSIPADRKRAAACGSLGGLPTWISGP